MDFLVLSDTQIGEFRTRLGGTQQRKWVILLGYIRAFDERSHEYIILNKLESMLVSRHPVSRCLGSKLLFKGTSPARILL